MEQYNKQNEIENNIVWELLDYERHVLLTEYPFLGVILDGIQWKISEGETGMEEQNFYVNRKSFISEFEENRIYSIRKFLHMLLHYIFMHDLKPDDNEECYDICADICAEKIILSMQNERLSLDEDDVRKAETDYFSQHIRPFSLSALLKEVSKNSSVLQRVKNCEKLFSFDSHSRWNEKTDSEEHKERLKLSKKLLTQMTTLSKGRGTPMMLALKEAVKERQSYREFLKRFVMPMEENHLSDEEIDLISYTYGLRLNDKLPLVEPVEYSEQMRIRDFVIAIDTSGSTAGQLLQNFLIKTYSVLTEENIFDENLNITIIQCDDRIRSEVTVKSRQQLETYARKIVPSGFGGTDFVPVFERVRQLRKQGKFKKLQGLVYFTDGRGRFPQECPDYPVAFVFVDDGTPVPAIPAWAMRVSFLPEEELS